MGKKKDREEKRRIVKPRIDGVLPPLIRPLSPFERRMSDLGPKAPRLGPVEAAHLQRMMEMDVGFQLKLKEIKKRLRHLIRARMEGGSGLQLSKLLRWYCWEYFNRLSKHGSQSLPGSFNVVESFMSFNREYSFFDLRDEVEHLLSINDYFRWYDSNDMPREPAVLEAIMTEGTIYSYEMVSDSGSLRISGDSQQVFAGVSLVRHNYELSCLLLAGEKPPLHADEDAADWEQVFTWPGREKIKPAPDLTIQDRYLDGYPGFAKVILLTRFDLRAKKHDVRYVKLDSGNSFLVLTDDASIFEGAPAEDEESYKKAALDGLTRYDDLFAALASMIYLPAFFAAFAGDVHELAVSTELHATREDKDVRQTIREIGERNYVAHRTIRCLRMASEVDDEPNLSIEPPDMEFKCDGYWRPIGPQEIGTDKGGQPIVGRTWVSRHESWSARSPQSFFLQRRNTEPEGPDPGVIYIQRSPAHGFNLYKIGLTRRSPQVRARELSSATGVPLPFDVLGNWNVGDCERVEREVHERLAAFRINPRKEFFRAELSQITRAIETVIKEFSE